jgi:hypothetical protein
MDKSMLYRDLVDSAEGDKHFSKAITPFTDADCDNYIKTLKIMEEEGKITLEECRLQESAWGKIVRIKGFIK